MVAPFVFFGAFDRNFNQLVVEFMRKTSVLLWDANGRWPADYKSNNLSSSHGRHPISSHKNKSSNVTAMLETREKLIISGVLPAECENFGSASSNSLCATLKK